VPVISAGSEGLSATLNTTSETFFSEDEFDAVLSFWQATRQNKVTKRKINCFMVNG
jgi:hypothetical protein